MSKNTIYRQDAVDAINELHDKPNAWLDLAVEALEKLPSAEPEIIKCKDCKFYSPMNRKTKTGICSLTMHQNFGDEWYCAGAERKTDE